MLFRESLESGIENAVESSQSRSLENVKYFFIPNCAFVSNPFLLFRQDEPMEISNEAVDNQSNPKYILYLNNTHVHKTTLHVMQENTNT
jgi:hypothetical protein